MGSRLCVSLGGTIDSEMASVQIVFARSATAQIILSWFDEAAAFDSRIRQNLGVKMEHNNRTDAVRVASGRAIAPAMRVGFRVGRYPTVSETFIASQIANLAKRGVDVSILADEVGTARENKNPALSIASTGSKHAPLQFLENRLPWRVKRAWLSATERRWAHRTDVVVCNFGWFGAQFARSFRYRGQAPPFVTIFHGDDVSRSLRGGGDRFYDELFAKCQLMLTVSELWRSRLLSLGAPPERVRVHRMGVDLSQHAFDPKPAQAPVRRILHVGRLVEKKGTEVLLRAIARLRQELPDASLHLTVIGTGPLEKSLRQKSAVLGLDGAVRFLGMQPHQAVRSHLAEADLFVLPSVTAADGDMEGIPVALMEAMAMGIPVVSTHHSGIPELIEHEEHGLLAAEHDAEDLVRQIHRLANDGEARRAMALRARRRIEQRFDQRRLLNELYAMLVDLADGCNRPRGERR
jgi:colanic acid/amylovoran biosynthesis glycosyltransferase